MGKHTQVKVGFVQFDVVNGDFENNLNNVYKGIEELTEKNDVELVVLPEMWSCGFDYPDLDVHSENFRETLKKLSKIALEKEIVIAGSIPEKEGSRIYNSLYIIEKDGEIAGKYRKIHLFSRGGEHKGFVRGEKPEVIETSVGRLGLMICYDIRFPELSRALTDLGADILVVSAQWPSQRQEHWEVLLRARAIEDQIFVVGCNRVGSDISEYIGGSMIISPKGRILYKAEEGFNAGSATLEFMEMIEYRSQIPALKERVKDAYEIG